MKKLFVVLLVVVVLAFVMPFYAGFKAKQELDQVVVLLNSNPGYEAEWSYYEKSWLATEAVLRIALNAGVDGDSGAARIIDIEVNIAIEHGPILPSTPVSLGWFAYNLKLSEQPSHYLSQYLTTKEGGDLFYSDGYMTLAGIVHVNNQVAPFTAESDGVKANFDGYIGAGTLEPSGLFRYAGEAEGLTLIIDDLGERAEITLSASSLALESDYGRLVKGTNMMPSKVTYKLPKVSMLADGSLSEFNDIAVNAEATLPEGAGIIDFVMGLKVANGYLDDEKINNLELVFSYDRISLQFIQGYMKMMEDSLANPDRMPDFTAYFTDEVIAEALGYQPGFSVKTLAFELVDGTFKTDMTLRIDTMDDVNSALIAANPMVLLQNILLDLNVLVDKPLAERLAKTQTLGAVEARIIEEQEAGAVGTYTEEQVQEMVSQEAVMMLEMLIMQGLIVDEKDSYKSTVKLEKGETVINGSPMPIPLGALLGLGM